MEAAAWADERPTYVQWCVADAAGAPIPTATVQNPEERERHRVHTETGCWVGSQLYLRDGSEVRFVPGAVVEMDVVAPGWVPASLRFQVSKTKRLNRVTIVLDPLPDLRAVDAEVARRTAEQYDRWTTLEAAFLAAPNEALAGDLFETRRGLTELANAWLAWAAETGADPTLAEHVCRAAAEHPRDCPTYTTR